VYVPKPRPVPDPTPWIRIARLLRPQGRRGELLAEILTDFPERFAQQPSVFLLGGKQPDAAQPAILENHWLHKGRVVLKFQGVDSISDAEALRGLDVVIRQEERAPLTDGSVYIDDLIGCVLADTRQPGAPVVGVIRNVLPQPPETADLLVLAGEDGREHLVPFAKAYQIHVDVAAQRVEMAIPDGLLAVNAPLTAEEQAVPQP
jgi:16S rRNA processing protein RimM